MDYIGYKHINCVYRRQFYTLGIKGMHFLLNSVDSIDFDVMKAWLVKCKKMLHGEDVLVGPLHLGAVVVDITNMTVNIRGVKFNDHSWFCFQDSSEFHCLTLSCSAHDVFETIEYFYHMITHLDS